jgi:TPR repeat protein
MVPQQAKLSYPANERVIDACVELLDAGRPLSEIIKEAQRLSAEGLSFSDPHAGEQPSAAQEGAAPHSAGKYSADTASHDHSGGVKATTGQLSGDGAAAGGQITAEPVGARREPRLVWLIAAATLLCVATGITGALYLPSVMATASIGEPAPTPTLAVSPAPTLAADASTASNPGPAPLTAEQIKAMVERGSTLVGSGDLASARLFYEPAVNAGDAKAAIYLGATYDPSFLKMARFGNGVRGDRDRAAYWYRRAGELGSSEAQRLG